MAYVDYCIYKFITCDSLLHLFRDEANQSYRKAGKRRVMSEKKVGNKPNK